MHVDHTTVAVVSVVSGAILGVSGMAIDAVKQKEKESHNLRDAAVQTVSSIVALEALPYIYESDDKTTNNLAGAGLTSVIFSLSDRYIMKHHSLVKSLLLSFTAELIAIYGADQIMAWSNIVMPKAKPVTGADAKAVKAALTDSGPSI